MKAVSLFSGCGGDTLGLHSAGYEVVAFSEFNKAAIATHLANFPHSEHLVDASNNSDITKIPNEVFQKYKDQIDIIFAGFPCQGFSRGGKRKATDPRNQMFQQFVRVTDQIKPHFIIGENVTGLASMKSGPNEDDPLMLDIIRQAFRQIGYELTYKVLEANEYGVPQKRKRILIIGWKSSVQFDPASYWAAVAAHGAAKTLPRMRSFITKSMDGAFLLTPQIIPQSFRDVALEVSDNAAVEGKPHPFVELKANERLLSCSKRDSPVHSEIINLDNPSKTIICTYDHQPRLLLGLKKPNGHCYARTLLPLELKQIQGFPADFIVTGNIKEQITQIGNAVPPQLVEAVATVLKGV